MHGEHDLTAELLDALPAKPARSPSRPQGDWQPPLWLRQASKQARLYLRVHRHQLQREAAAALRGVNPRCSKTTASPWLNQVHTLALRLLHLVARCLRRYQHPRRAVGLKDSLRVVPPAHAPPVGFVA